MNDEAAPYRAAEVTRGHVAFVRLRVEGDVEEVSQNSVAEVSLGQVAVEVAAVLQRRKFVPFAKATLYHVSGLLFRRDFIASPITNNDV